MKHLAMSLPATAYKELTWREGSDRKLRSRYAAFESGPLIGVIGSRSPTLKNGC